MLAIVTLCGISITAGYHRLWSHNAYNVSLSNTSLFCLLGHSRPTKQYSLYGPLVIDAITGHIDDNNKDPYSINRGFWFAHIGWMLRAYPSGEEDFSNVKGPNERPYCCFPTQALFFTYA